MKVFVSYSEHDSDFAQILVNSLIINGIDTWPDGVELKPANNLLNQVKNIADECDCFIAVLSKNYLGFQDIWGQLSVIGLINFIIRKKKVLSILTEDCEIPIFLQDKILLDFRVLFSPPFKKLIALLTETRTESGTKETDATGNKALTAQFQLNDIRQHKNRGQLCLFCGEELSLRAGIPVRTAWLADLLEKYLGEEPAEDDLHDFEKNFNPDSIKLLLKYGLGKDFLPLIRNELYNRLPGGSAVIDSIARLFAHKKTGSANAVITYSIDNLLESKLLENGVKCIPVFKDGQAFLKDTLPVFYINGYVPREGDLKRLKASAFPEEDEQPGDAKHWTNKIQVSHLSQDLCVFIGINLADALLKVLLGTAMGSKNPVSKPNHYIFKVRYENKEEFCPEVIKIAEVLDEFYARYLGLHIIWVDCFDDISCFLDLITNE